VPVAEDEGDPDREGDQPLGPTDVQRLTLAAEDRGDELRVARQPTDRGGRELGAVARDPEACETGDGGVGQPALQRLQGHGDHQSGGCAVGLRRQLGAEPASGGLDQGVPHPDTGVTRVVDQAAVVLVDGRCRCREWEQGGPEQGAVLGAPAALEADAAGAVGGDGQEPRQVGDAFLPRELLLEAAVFSVGVDHMDQVSPGPGQVGGVEAPGMLHHGLLAASPDRGARGEGVDGGDDHLGLLG
jgi:hypothetical protein